MIFLLPNVDVDVVVALLTVASFFFLLIVVLAADFFLAEVDDEAVAEAEARTRFRLLGIVPIASGSCDGTAALLSTSSIGASLAIIGTKPARSSSSSNPSSEI